MCLLTAAPLRIKITSDMAHNCYSEVFSTKYVDFADDFNAQFSYFAETKRHNGADFLSGTIALKRRSADPGLSLS